jgi:fatty acid desaturase 2 (delta-6 desaturase)
MSWNAVVRIDGVEYDVTDFKHPGGKIIRYSLASDGADATHAFKAFHGRSKKAMKVLASLPHRKPALEIRPGLLATEQSTEGVMLLDFEKLEAELKRDGYFDLSYPHFINRIIQLVLLYAACLFLWSRQYILSGVMLRGLFGSQAGWLQHEVGHGSTPMAHKWLQRLIITAAGSMSAHEWQRCHFLHHAATQKIGKDHDMDAMPLVAFHDKAAETSKIRLKWPTYWYRAQAILFLPIITVAIGFIWMTIKHPAHVVRHGLWSELLLMFASHFVNTVVFMGTTGCGNVGAGYLLGHMASMYVAYFVSVGHFALSHTFTPVVEKDTHKSWVRSAIDHTVNISPENPLVCWIMGYLNCQIEHHLWPQMPQFRQPEVSRRVQAFCMKHGMEYKVLSYPRAWYELFSHLNRVGEHYYADE